jgi:hypothetical protein
VIYIDVPADLNAEGDDGRNFALIADAVEPAAVVPGAVLVAGAPSFWSWVLVDSVEEGVAYLRQVPAREAARRGRLVAPLPRPA